MRRLLAATFIAIPALLTAVPASAAPLSDEVLEAQILLDLVHQSPGVIDGRWGSNTRRAIAAFERSAGLPVDGELDDQLISQMRAHAGSPLIADHRITPDEVSGLVNVPSSMTAQASLDHLGYTSAVEALAERFHVSQSLLKELNPGTTFAAGEIIRVVRSGDGKLATKVTRIEIDKQNAELRALDADGNLIASYPATIGSDTFPSPSGDMMVRTVAPKPVYYFDPDGRDWGPHEKLTIAAGPNNPVGGTWIDLTKDGYGIHGTPEPRLIGKTASHGCVRLTNWDAAELAAAVSSETIVSFL